MPLTLCPECSREISDRAPACPHCGYPMGDAQTEQRLYAVVLRAADYNDLKMVERIQAATHLTEEKAAEIPHRLPFTLKRGLTYGECQALIHTFSANTVLDIIHDEDADTPGNAVPIAQNIPQAAASSGLSFWAVVGAVILGVIIISFL